ncbi:MAG: hypothetical protein GY798_16105 [Hyphomicrobiales bacterium]|nr:hypothetical protein [Hyphomicrobiales bacterium]
MATIKVTHPGTLETFEKDVDGLLKYFADYIHLIDPDVVKTINDKVETGDDANWLIEWADHVGPEEAGKVVLGSLGSVAK